MFLKLRLLSIFTVFLVVVLFSACEPWANQFSNLEDALLFEAQSKTPPPDSPGTLTILTWNIKFGGGNISFYFDCYSENTAITKKEVLANLEGLASKLTAVDPDIVLLQEVDLESKRTAYVNEIQWLLDHTDLNYGAYASIWETQFFPHHGTGRINTGNAILSRWKLDQAQRIALSPRQDHKPYEQYLYIHRNILRARVAVPGQEDFWALVVHTAAFSRDSVNLTKKDHIERFQAELDYIDADGGLFVAGGDLNEIPRYSLQMVDFPDQRCDDPDLQADTFPDEIGWLDGIYARYSPAILLADFADTTKQHLYYTFSGRPTEYFWNRKLDYLFTNRLPHPRGWIPGSAVTHQDDTRELSDHAPLSALLKLP